MGKNFIAPTTYFLQEGRENLEECLKIAFQGAVQHDIEKLVIFTAKGDGVKIAQDMQQADEEYRSRQLIAVTFPAGTRFTDSEKKPIKVEVSAEDRAQFAKDGIPIVQAHFPFDAMMPGAQGATVREASLLGDALNLFCGSMSLCVQAALVACDAGAVDPGEHIISLTADTAILVTAAPTRYMLSRMIIREILCKPAIMTIKHNEASPELPKATNPAPMELDAAELKKLAE